jgi:uncharacterized protein (UPF0216 family)
MNTKQELEQLIINMTNKINQEFPELLKFIKEMPDNNAENNNVTIKSLENYYNSLKELVNKYAKTHS